MTTQLTEHEVSRAEAVASILRRDASHSNRLAWALDSALSMRRKSLSGYRAAEVTGDGPWNPLEYDQRVRDALAGVFEPPATNHDPLPSDQAATLGRVYGGDKRLVHIPDHHRADVGKAVAAFIDARMREVQTFNLPPTAPLCPGCYMVVIIDAAIALAEADGQDPCELGRSLAHAFAHVAEGRAYAYTEEVEVIPCEDDVDGEAVPLSWSSADVRA